MEGSVHGGRRTARDTFCTRALALLDGPLLQDTGADAMRRLDWLVAGVNDLAPAVPAVARR